MAGPVPQPPSARERARFQAQRRRDTAPELLLRSELHRRGHRYRVDARPLPAVNRRADLVFSRARLAVFVDGCFWHSCPDHGTQPGRNGPWWADKLAANRARDADTDARLAEAGWRVVRVWEHEDVLAAADRIGALLAAGP